MCINNVDGNLCNLVEHNHIFRKSSTGNVLVTGNLEFSSSALNEINKSFNLIAAARKFGLIGDLKVLSFPYSFTEIQGEIIIEL